MHKETVYTDKEIDLLLQKDPDFINSKRFNYSIKEALKSNPHGVKPDLICRFLKMDIQTFSNKLQEVLDKLQTSILSY